MMIVIFHFHLQELTTRVSKGKGERQRGDSKSDPANRNFGYGYPNCPFGMLLMQLKSGDRCDEVLGLDDTRYHLVAHTRLR